MKCVDARNMHGRGRYGKFGRKCLKEKLNLEDTYEERTRTPHTVEQCSWICGLDSCGFGCRLATGCITFMLWERPQTCFTKCVSEVLCSIHKDELKPFITMPKYLVLQKTYLINHDGFTPIHSGSRQSVYKQLALRSAGGSILINPLNHELNPICYLLALLGAHHFLHVNRIGVKLLTFRLLMSYIYIYMEHPFLMFLDHTTTQHSL